MDTFFLALGVALLAWNLGFILFQVLTNTVVGYSIKLCGLSIVLALVLVLQRL